VPWNEDLIGFVKDNNGSVERDGDEVNIQMPFKSKEVPLIRKLKKAIHKVIGRDSDYPNRNWKWVVPRIVQTLEDFAQNLVIYREHQKLCSRQG